MNNHLREGFPTTPTSSAQDNLKRRSSSRSIKRKKFDDELVECSLPAKLPKTRTNSLSYDGSAPSTPIPTTTAPIFETPLPVDHSHGKIKKPVVKNIPPSSPTPSMVPPPSPNPAVKRNLSRKMKPLTQGQKDLGRWKPSDDLALISSILQTNDIKAVHRGVKFTCKFSFNEVLQRWYTLLYDPNLSRLSVQAMKNLHPEIMHNIQAKTLFSKEEEELLGTIKANTNPSLEIFADLLKKNPLTFHKGRTPKSLSTHWSALKAYHLLPDQTVPSASDRNIKSFSEFEDSIAQSELVDVKDPLAEFELAQNHRLEKKEIRKLEDEMKNWAVIVEQVTGVVAPEMDKQTYAILKGRVVRYLMKFKDVTIGRSTAEHTVDIDLSLEGPAWKVSRRQGMIRMRNNGDFFIVNEGKRPIYVDGRPILCSSKYKLSHNSVIEISGLQFIFIINQSVVNSLKSEGSKSIPPSNAPSSSSSIA